MSVSAVDTAIRKIREVVKEWDAVGLNYWREDHTRYGVIDPIIRELGWDTSDPKECHPEYPRSYQNGRRADYAMFGSRHSGHWEQRGAARHHHRVQAFPGGTGRGSPSVAAVRPGFSQDAERRGGPDQRESVVDLRPLPPGFLHQQAGSAGGYHHRRPSGRCPDPAPVAGTFQVRLIRLLSPRVVSGVRTAQVLPVCSCRQVPPV